MEAHRRTSDVVLRRRASWLIVSAALVCRLGVFFLFPSVFDFVSSGTIHGSEAYDAYARHLLATGVYGREAGRADAAVPPVYGIVLAGIYAAAGRTALWVALAHTLFDLLSLALLWRIGLALTGRVAVAAMACLAVAAYPYLVFQSLALNDTALFILELHLIVWLAVLSRRASGRWCVVWPALTGVALGAAALTRPVALPLGAWIALWWGLDLGWRASARRALPLAICAVLVVGGWTARNAVTLGTPVVFATNGGSNFWQGNNARTLEYLRAGYDMQWIPPPPRLEAIDYRDPASNGAFLAAALDYLREHRREALALWWTKARVHWSLDVFPWRNPSSAPDPAPGRDRAGRAPAADGRLDLSGLHAGDAVAAYSQPLFDRVGRTVHRAFFGTALLLSILGLAATARDWRNVALLWFVQANMTLAYVAFHPSTRYRLPSDPLLFVFAASGVLVIVGWVARTSAPWRAVTAPDARGTRRRTAR
jgi:hypothetical protein